MSMKVWRLSLTTTRDLTEEEYQQYKQDMPLPIDWGYLERIGHTENRSRLMSDEEVVTRIQLQRMPREQKCEA